MTTKGAVEPFVLVSNKALQFVDSCVELRFTEVVDVEFTGGLAPRLKDVEVLSGDLVERLEGVELPCKVCKGEFSFCFVALSSVRLLTNVKKQPAGDWRGS